VQLRQNPDGTGFWLLKFVSDGAYLQVQQVLTGHLHAELAERALIRLLPPLPSPALPPGPVEPKYYWKIKIDGKR
jgi:hypothetical protein